MVGNEEFFIISHLVRDKNFLIFFPITYIKRDNHESNKLYQSHLITSPNEFYFLKIKIIISGSYVMGDLYRNVHIFFNSCAP